MIKDDFVGLFLVCVSCLQLNLLVNYVRLHPTPLTSVLLVVSGTNYNRTYGFLNGFINQKRQLTF